MPDLRMWHVSQSLEFHPYTHQAICHLLGGEASGIKGRVGYGRIGGGRVPFGVWRN
ncbi:hypothetical protein SESBI_19149 [Sesbania bispinosa]|nr:hypothetical protein SESBI_19149 [Sesbania bispinosa]